MAGSKHQSADIRKQQILNASEKVLVHRGIEKFTIDQVAEEADVSKGTVYKYYKSKDQILSELSVNSLSMMHEVFEEAAGKESNAIDKLQAICMASYRFNNSHKQHYELIQLMERPDFNIKMEDYMRVSYSIQALTDNIVRQGIKKGEIDSDYDPQMTTYIIWSACIGVMQFIETKKNLMKEGFEVEPEEFVRVFARMITRGLKK
ncbi:MAG: TetR/AcrR family transcriptional regulator [Roseivirga sp.]